MKHYELSCLVSSQLSDEEIKAFSEKITSLIKSEGGESVNIDSLTKKRMGYMIKHERQAWFLVASFELSPEKLEGLNAQLKSLTEILRFMVVNQKPLSEMDVEEVVRKPRAIATPEKENIAEKETKEEKPSIKEPKKEKVELEEIDKKLEEILGEN